MPGVNVVPVSPGTFGEAMRIGEVLAESGFFADTPTAAKAIVKMLAGRELGFGPIQSMTGVDIIQGQVAVKPKLLASAIQRSGRWNYRVVEGRHTEQECAIEFTENGTVVGTSVFTMADATKAALAGKDSWRKYPRNMLWARAMSNGANWYCAGVFGGPVYTPEQLGAEVDEEGAMVSAPPVAMDATAPGAASTPEPPPAPERTLDQAIADGDIEGVEPAPEAPVSQDDRTLAQAAAQAPAPAEPAAAEPSASTPSELARGYGIDDATQRFILITVAEIEDVDDLDAAYKTLDDEQLRAVTGEWRKRAKA